jgi:hypothetical protein
VATVQKTISDSLWAPRAGASLLGLFGILALVLAAVGMYSVMSYSVSQRQREIGIRMALGANRADVLRMVMGRGMTVVGIGLGVGLALATALSRLAGHMLVGISPWDAVSFGWAALVLVSVAVLANFFPPGGPRASVPPWPSATSPDYSRRLPDLFREQSDRATCQGQSGNSPSPFSGPLPIHAPCCRRAASRMIWTSSACSTPQPSTPSTIASRLASL